MKTILTVALITCCIPATHAQENPRSLGTHCTENCAASSAPSHAATVPVNAGLVTENEFIQVLRMSVPARSETLMHDVTPRVVVWLSDAHFVDHFADGTSKEETRKAGDAEWVPARRHAGQNLLDKPMEFIAVIVKKAAAGEHPLPKDRTHP